MARSNSKLTTDNIYVGEGHDLRLSSSPGQFRHASPGSQDVNMSKMSENLQLACQIGSWNSSLPQSVKSGALSLTRSGYLDHKSAGLEGLSRESSLSDTAKPK